MAQPAPFIIQPVLTAIALTYNNREFVADRVFPRIPVISPNFKWTKFTVADMFTIPDTRVGRKSRPGEIDWTAIEQLASTIDYGLDDSIPNFDVLAAKLSQQIYGVTPIDPAQRSTSLLTSLVALDREARAAALAFNAANYAAANKITLSGTSQWSDFVNSEPVQAILLAKDSCLITPNKLLISQFGWSKLRTHPKVTAFVLPMGGQATGGGAAVSKEAFAMAFELDEIVVGQAFQNTSKPGQPAAMSRLWGKHALLFYQPSEMSSTEGIMTYGFTAQFGEKIAGVIQNDPNIGLRGGDRVRVGESVAEVITAADAAYFFQNIIP